MPDYVMALNQKRMAIQNQKDQLYREYKTKLISLDSELDAVNEALAVMNEAVKDILCKRCDGSGMERYCDAAGDIDERPCAACRGTGITMKG